jgi:hypothetical protein
MYNPGRSRILEIRKGIQMKRKPKKILILSILLLIPAIAIFLQDNSWCANYYVKPDGAGTTCSRLAPCDFAYALGTKASAGDHIFFKEGTLQTHGLLRGKN